MSSDPIREIRAILDDVAASGERVLPRWAAARVVRHLRSLGDDGERRAAVTALSGGPFTADLNRALARSTERPPSIRVRDEQGRGREFKGRQLADVPSGLRVTYQGAGATVRPPGMVLDTGEQFETPTPAAEAVNGGTPVNGWEVWKVADGRSLADCYDARDWPSI